MNPRETPMTMRYWKRIGGTVVFEYPLFVPNREGGVAWTR